MANQIVARPMFSQNVNSIKRFLMSIFIFTMIAFTNSQVHACTEIELHYGPNYMVGKNLDWYSKYAYLVINPVGIRRQALDLTQGLKPLSWIAKYGSVTEDLTDKNNQVDMNVVTGGMNQFGLSGSVLWLEDSAYPKIINKPALSTGQWIQYLLDNAKNVSEAIQLSKNIDISPSLYQGAKILTHLYIHDAGGNSAILEYHQGKLVIYQGKNLPIPALANNPYEKSVQSIKQYKYFGGNLPLPGGDNSATRFVNATAFINNLPTITSREQAIAYTFNALGYLIEIPGGDSPTVWSVVFDLSDKTLYYRDIDNPNIRYINLNDTNLSQGQSTKVLLLNNTLSGNIAKYFHVLNTQ